MQILYALGGVLALVAWVLDSRTRKIPNWLNFGGMLVMLLGKLLWGYQQQLALFPLVLQIGGGFATPFFLLLPLFYMGGFGAGDVKLMMVLGIVLGSKLAFLHVLVTAVIGGIMAIGVFVQAAGWQEVKTLIQNRGRGLRTHPKMKVAFPYSMAILMGYLIVLINFAK